MEMMAQNNGKFEMLQTKVSPEAYRRMKSIERKKGITAYGFIQMVVDTLIRYMDVQHNLTPEIGQAMNIFEHMEGWRDALNLADPTVKKVIGEAIYFLYDEDGKRKGARAIHVTRPFFGNWSEDENIQHIIERVFSLLIPERFRRLWQLEVELGCNGLLELLDYIIDHFSKEADVAELRRTFEDADRAENGRPLAYGQRTRRKKLQSPDDMDGDQYIIRFTDDDKDIQDNSTY